MNTIRKLIALDMDGTLLSSDKTVSVENTEWIERARVAGIEVTLSTGRHYNNTIVQDVSKRLDVRVPLVTLNGSEVWTHDGHCLARHHFADGDMTFLHQLVIDSGVEFLGFTTAGLVNREQFPSDITVDAWLKFVLFTEDTRMLEHLNQTLRSYSNFELSSSTTENIEVNPRGVSKASGLEVVCNQLNITRLEVVAMGDGFNDVEMLRFAGLGIAMGNAPIEVKRAADWVTEHCDNHGVACAIERLLRNPGPN